MKLKSPLVRQSNPSQDQNIPNSWGHEYLSLSALAWPAWLRLLVVLPVIVFLWLALAWANEGQAWW